MNPSDLIKYVFENLKQIKKDIDKRIKEYKYFIADKKLIQIL